MDKPESIPLRGRPNLLGLGHLHIVGGPGWPARVVTDEQTRPRKHAPLTGRPTATGWRTTSWTNETSTGSSRTSGPDACHAAHSPGSCTATARAARSLRRL